MFLKPYVPHESNLIALLYHSHFTKIFSARLPYFFGIKRRIIYRRKRNKVFYKEVPAMKTKRAYNCLVRQDGYPSKGKINAFKAAHSFPLRPAGKKPFRSTEASAPPAPMQPR